MYIPELQKSFDTIRRSGWLMHWDANLPHVTLTIAPRQHLNLLLVQLPGTAPEQTLNIQLRERSTVRLYGIMLGTGTNHLRHTITITHEQPGTQSRMLIRGIALDAASCISEGTVHIKKNAQLSDSRLEQRILLVGEKASANTVPNLEIQADDVKASHAATVSRIPDDELFYLTTRGLTPNRAQKLILASFLGRIISLLPESKERAKLEAIIQHQAFTSHEHLPQ